jgi:hypothetical protein
MSNKQPVFATASIAFLMGAFVVLCLVKIASSGFAFGQWLATISP